MPIPLILWGAAALATAFGAKKAVDAHSDNSSAERLREDAESIFDDAKNELEAARKKTATRLDELGWLKLNVWDRQMGRFVDLVEKVRNVELTGQASNDEFRLAQFTRQELGEIRNTSLKASEVVSAGTTALGAGALAGVAGYGGVMMFGSASTGAAIAGLSGVAATNATLAWLGGGSLAAGGMGVAGGMAVLGGIIAAPVLAVGGMLYASKARENLANARSDHARARTAAEEMNNAAAKLEAIDSVAETFSTAINILDQRMTYVLNNLAQCLSVSENREREKLINKIKSLFGIKIHPNYATMSLDEQQTLHLSYQIAQIMKILLETPLLTQNGVLRPEDDIKHAFMNIIAIDSSQKLLPELHALTTGSFEC